MRISSRYLLLVLLIPIGVFSGWVARQDLFYPVQVAITYPDGKRLATVHARWWPSSRDAVIRVWDLENGRMLHELRSAATTIAFSPTGSELAVGNADGTVTLHDPDSLAKHATFRVGESQVVPLSYLNKTRLLVWTEQDSLISLNISTGSFHPLNLIADSYILKARGNKVLLVHGDRTSTGRSTGGATLFESTSGGLIERRTIELSAAPARATLSGRGDYAAIWLRDQRKIVLWRLDDGQVEAELIGDIVPNGVGFADAGRQLVAYDTEGRAEIWDIANSQRVGAWATGKPTRLQPVYPSDSGLVHQSDPGFRVRALRTGEVVAVLPMSLRRFLVLAALASLLLVTWSTCWIRGGLRAATSRPLFDTAVVHVLLLAILLVRFVTTDTREDVLRPVVMPLFAELVTPLSLAAIWLIHGSQRWLSRVAGLVFFAAMIGAVVVAVWRGAAFPVWQTAVGAGGYFGVLITSLLIMRRQGFAVVGSDIARPLDSPLRASQVTIRDMMLFATAAATLFAVARFLEPAGLPMWLVLFLMVNGASYAVVSLVAVWAALGQNSWWLRGPVFLAVAATIGFVPSAIFYNSPVLPWWWYLIVHSLIALFVFATLLVFRWHGYRLGRPARRRTHLTK